MKFFYLVLFLGNLYMIDCARKAQRQSEYNDNDFAEFEDFDEGIPGSVNTRPARLRQRKQDPPKVIQVEVEEEPEVVIEEELTLESDDDDEEQKESSEDIVQLKEEEVRERKWDFDDDEEAVVEEEDDNDEYSHFSDEEEFIGFDSDRPQSNGRPLRGKDEPKITIAKVPLHLRSNWDSFYLEMLMITGLAVYFMNFMLGKGKNQKLATAWFTSHRSLLESNFSLVGDDGKATAGTPRLLKESENVYILWCSGRMMVEGMLIEIKLLKRQDLIAVISQLIRPSSDQLIAKINLDVMDTFVFFVGTKKADVKIAKEMTDICTYCPEKKSAEKYVFDSHYVIHSELADLNTVILRDSKMTTVLSKYPGLLEYMHFSDQYSGPKQQEESTTNKPPDVKKTLIFCFNLPGKGNPTVEEIEELKPLMQLILYMTDKISRFKISKESKSKAEKNRCKVEEAFMRGIHNARAEIAQQTREDKRRKERERIMSLDDPERQRKWEERDQKRQMKKRAPKMKTLKIKPM